MKSQKERNGIPHASGDNLITQTKQQASTYRKPGRDFVSRRANKKISRNRQAICTYDTR